MVQFEMGESFMLRAGAVIDGNSTSLQRSYDLTGIPGIMTPVRAKVFSGNNIS
jgi:hypothetical protein